MCKKLGVTALVVVAAMFVLHKLDLDSYLKVWLKRSHADIQKSIPPEAKIERLRDEIAKLGPEEGKARRTIAAEMVAVTKLRNQVADSKANLEKREANLKALRTDLDNGVAFVTVDGKKIPSEKIKDGITRQWESFKAAKESVKSQEDLLKSREEALEVAKAKLETMQDKRREMEAKVDKMELELRKLRLAQTQHNIAIDDTQMATVLRLADEIGDQIDVAKTELNLEKGASTDTAVEEALARKAKTDQALKEMDDFFGGAKVTKKE